jgi:hypothetical protein
MSSRWSGGDNNYCYLVVPLFFTFCGIDAIKGLKARRIEDQKIRG